MASLSAENQVVLFSIRTLTHIFFNIQNNQNPMITLLQSASGQQSMLPTILMMVVLFVIVYFFMIRPQQKKQKEIQKFRNSLTVGQEVVTIGGLHGTIKSIANNTIVLKVATGVDLTFEKSAIVPVGTPAGQQA